MRFLSLFSGIEAASVAWEPLGWSPVGFCEIDPFPCALLGHRYPSVPNLGSVTEVTGETLEPLGQIDLTIFGWPCQDHSVAGKRAGLAGKRSGLFYEAARIVRLAAERGCKWFVAENVPGVLSSDGGRDFAEVIREITGYTFPVPRDGWGNGGVVGGEGGGWSLAWRVLDAQFFGVPQRRRRVFLVGRAGDWRGPAAVLFERHSLSGNPPPSRAARTDVAGCLGGGSGRRGWCDDLDRAGAFIPDTAAALTGSLGRRCGVPDGGDTKGHLIAGTLTREYGEQSGNGMGNMANGLIAHTLRGEGFDASEDGTGRGTPLVPIAFNPQAGGKQTSLGYESGSQTTGTLSVCQTPAIAGSAVRRLTPLECERLQGFPDQYTAVPYRGKFAADGPRYKALGNSMAVPVMRWLGQRIDLVSELMEANQ